MKTESERVDSGKELFEVKRWQEYVRLNRERPELFQDSGQLKIIKDEAQVREFEARTKKKIGVLYKSEYNIWVVDLVEDEKGNRFTYERLIPAVKKGAVVIVPIHQGRFVLLKQYRHIIQEYQYAFPRGFGEEGLSELENARKELWEELGVKACDMKRLGTVIADSGVGCNRVTVFSCHIQQPELKYHYEGIEEIIELTKDEIKEWIESERFTDGFTLAALSMYNAKM